ncbi:hypothetical protein [Pseudoduganella sp. R-34]|uniref:hypothetical protein n=1 Tax=Pseudoduganella sp. R-34 TaxID=3404062 RepID=UPI003CF6C5BE
MLNSLEEAATWLSESQGITWTPTRILDHVVRMGLKGAASDSNALTSLTVALPDDEVVGIYRLDSQVRRLAALRRGVTFHIDLMQAFDLLEQGHALVAAIPSGTSNSALEVALEPPGKTVKVTRDMIRVSRHGLKALEQAARSGGSLVPSNQVKALSELPPSETEWTDMMVVVRSVAMDYGWNSETWFPLARKALNSLEEWDGGLLSTLRLGPRLAASRKRGVENGALLTSQQLIDAFGDLTTLQLSKTLANGKALWLKGIRKYKGSRGKGDNSLWHPVEFAIALEDRYGVSRSRLTARFQTRTELAPWLEEWSEKSSYGEEAQR